MFVTTLKKYLLNHFVNEILGREIVFDFKIIN